MNVPADGDAGERLRELGWRQGTVFEVPSGSKLQELLGRNASFAIVASQDCDVVLSAETEWNIDVLPMKMGAAPSGNLLHVKNPRQLCLPLSDGQFAELDIRERVTIAKSTLLHARHRPELMPVDADLKRFARWLGKRYSRPALPDVFNRRLERADRKLGKLSKKPTAESISAILVRLRPDGEADAATKYELAMWFVAGSAAARDNARRRELEEYASQFVAAVDACEGLHVADYDVVGQDEVTLDDLEVLTRLDFDHRSKVGELSDE